MAKLTDFVSYKEQQKRDAQRFQQQEQAVSKKELLKQLATPVTKQFYNDSRGYTATEISYGAIEELKYYDNPNPPVLICETPSGYCFLCWAAKDGGICSCGYEAMRKWAGVKSRREQWDSELIHIGYGDTVSLGASTALTAENLNTAVNSLKNIKATSTPQWLEVPVDMVDWKGVYGSNGTA